ncbi:tumor necrosis factor receptor superfamily member 22-like isoform X3 [Eublepharis macularius]|uniref:Tumor necrosis factor receptor superfamily member 22-like isoform X3 n=1 Tax=Eublepharis macularius TaxID=481883 RepID=A0AA97KTA6_EUBMA|nr:tumor necrosis factor receptor superfamily member 22-like isoform X3 [Eublepharis macularius]
MAEGLWTALLLGMMLIAAKVESPPLQSSCGNGEYDYSGICCKNCPAGTHVDEPCTMPHTLGHCADCTEGEDYTAHENGLEMCLLCDECKSDKTMVKACTVRSNTECKCNDGYYCPPDCEECLRCKTRCPEGQVTLQNCNATADMECGLPPTGISHVDDISIWSIPLSLVAVGSVIIVVISIFLCYKKCCVPCRNEEKSASDRLVQPSNSEHSAVIKPSHDELNEICEELTNRVLVRDWMKLMRNAGLSDNEIDTITYDYPSDTHEQKHRMLKTLYDRFGTQNALCKLLNGLQQMKLINIYENLRNELLSKNINIVKDKGKCLYFVKKSEVQNL